MGATRAHTGSSVGSVPVSQTGSTALSTTAMLQMTATAMASPIQRRSRRALPRSLDMPHSSPSVAMRPQIQVRKAGSGRCSCSLPLTRSGATRLTAVTPTQMAATPNSVQAIHDRSAVTRWYGSAVTLVVLRRSVRRRRSVTAAVATGHHVGPYGPPGAGILDRAGGTGGRLPHDRRVSDEQIVASLTQARPCADVQPAGVTTAAHPDRPHRLRQGRDDACPGVP